MSKIAGGEFRLLCGQIGAGKSYLYVKQVEEIAKKSGKYKNIYSNIRAHAELADGIKPIPDDWRDCETDSLLIIDEVQKHDKFSKHFSSRRDSEIVDLTMIRHQRIDIWMISPNPTLVNKDVRDLVTQYWWLEVISAKATKCYCFTKVYINITKSVKMQAYEEFVYILEEKYHNLYKSTEDGKPSGRNYNFNMKLWGFVGGLVVVTLIICAMVFFLMKGTKSKVNQMQQVTKKEESVANNPPVANENLGVFPKLSDDECRKGINVDKPECIEYFNKLTNNNMSVTDNSVSYNPSKPYDLDPIQEKVSYTVTSKPIFAGCMKRAGKYVAYTQQGTILHDVSSDDCRRLIENGDRPFNYFAKEQMVNNSQINNPINQISEQGLI